MTDNKLPTAVEVTGHWNEAHRLGETVYGNQNLEEGDKLVRREDILELIDQELEDLRSEVDTIEEEHLLSDSGMDNRDANILRKRYIKAINILKNIKRQVKQ